MGAWGFRVFEDDCALDWLGDFSRLPSVDHLHTAFAALLKDSDVFIDDRLGAIALAAAEIVAAMNGRPSELLPADVTRWALNQGKPNEGLVNNAIASVLQVFENSELREIWEDSENVALWKEAIDELINRLG